MKKEVEIKKGKKVEAEPCCEYHKLNPVKFGIAVAVICAVYGFLVVVFADKFPMNADFLEEIYGWLGYGSGIKSILGIIYPGIDGFVGGAVFAWIYNKLL